MSIQSCLGFLAQLATPAWKWFAALMASWVAYVLPQPLQRDMAIGTFTLIIVDTVTGVYAAYVTGKAIKSAKMSRVLAKILGYGSVLVVASVTGRYLTPNLNFTGPAQVLVLTLIIATEGVSICENVHRMGLINFKFLTAALRGRAEELDEPKKP